MKYILIYVWLASYGYGSMKHINLSLEECNKQKQVIHQFMIDQKRQTDTVVCIRDDSGDIQ
jgi:hypothetical protein